MTLVGVVSAARCRTLRMLPLNLRLSGGGSKASLEGLCNVFQAIVRHRDTWCLLKANCDGKPAPTHHIYVSGERHCDGTHLHV